MSELTPCPECQRHVRKTETRCPFCGEAVSLAHVPSPALPGRRLGRAATFAFGASVVGATALGACTIEDPGGGVAVYGAPPSAGAGGSFGGGLVYGSPPSGGADAGNDSVGDSGAPAGSGGGAAGGAGAGGAPPSAGAGGEASGGDGGYGGDLALYGGPPK